MISPKEIYDIIGRNTTQRTNYERQAKYYSGTHPTINAPWPKEDPDNRLSVPIPRKAVDFIVGYMAKPGNVVYSGDFYENKLKRIFNECEETILTAEELQSACIHGSAYELHWTDGKNKYFAEVPTSQAIIVYTDEIGIFSKVKLFIRYWTNQNQESYAEVWDERERGLFKKNGGNYEPINIMLHGYKEVPVVEYNIAKEKTNLFDHITDILDALDRGLSEDIADELQRFASSYLLIANRISTDIDDNGESEIDKLKRTRIFEGLQDAVKTKVDFLTKTINPEFINTALDRLERLTYELLGVPNPNDDTFAASSGIALAYKLVPLEFLVTKIETYFSRGLQKRIRLLSGIDSVLTGDVGQYEINISFKRNLPFDLASMADVVMKLKGVLSDETILKLFPSSIVSDVEEELERMQAVDEFMDITKPQEDGAEIVATGGNVANTALNGAQVSSLIQIAIAVSDKTLPLETAIEIVLQSFPTMDREEAIGMLTPASKMEVPTPAPIVPFPTKKGPVNNGAI